MEEPVVFGPVTHIIGAHRFGGKTSVAMALIAHIKPLNPVLYSPRVETRLEWADHINVANSVQELFHDSVDLIVFDDFLPPKTTKQECDRILSKILDAPKAVPVHVIITSQYFLQLNKNFRKHVDQVLLGNKVFINALSGLNKICNQRQTGVTRNGKFFTHRIESGRLLIEQRLDAL